MADEKLSYTLKHPIVTHVHDGTAPKEVTVRELAIDRRVKGRHLRATDGATGPADAKLKLLGALSGLDDEQMDELDEADLQAIDKLLGEEDGKPSADPLSGADGGSGGPKNGERSSSA